MKILLGALVLTLAFLPCAFAEFIELKSGNIVEGRVISETDTYVQIEANGAFVTYYKDEISRRANTRQELENQVPVEKVSSDEEWWKEDTQFENSFTEELAEVTKNDGGDESYAVSLTDTERRLLEGMDKRQLILEFMDVFGTRATLRATYENMLTKLTPEQLAKVKSSVTVESITENLLPIYDQHFTAHELKTYVAFYSSEEGRKLLQTIPVIMQESVERSMTYLKATLPPDLQ